MSRKKQYDHDEPEPEQPIEEMEKMPGGEIQPGCSEPNTVPPSVTGTSQDPNRKEE